MQNFLNTKWENMSEDEVFMDNQKLVLSTIKRQFPNRASFCGTHMIGFDDLIQMGNIGLLNAIRTYKSDSKVQFRTHAINHIVWEITTQAKSESLRNINTQTFEVANIVSASKLLVTPDGSEEINILSTLAIPKEKETSEIGDSNILESQVIAFLKKDEEVDEELLYIFVARINGDSMETIAKRLGIHRNSISGRLRTVRAKRIKGRLQNFLQNGETA